MKNSHQRVQGVASSFRSVLFVLAVMVVQTGQTQVLPESSVHFRVSKFEEVVDIGPDLLSHTERLIERVALSDQGSVLIGKYAQFYDNENERWTVMEAYTRKPDGKRVAVGADGIQKQSGMASTGFGASWPNAEVLQVTFPNVNRGDTAVIKLQGTTTALPLDGWVSMADSLPPTVDFEAYTLRLSAPPGFELRTVGNAYKTRREDRDGKTVWVVEGQSSAKPMDQNAIDTLQVWPHFVASSLRSHEELVQAYALKSDAKAQVQAPTQALVDGIVKGMATDQDKARALHNWVRSNIRYVAIYLGAGGWLPHEVDWILANRYGDCKDHVLLLQVLLKAAGIEAVPALINTNSEYSLPELPVETSFNHVILYLPVMDLFVDPTATTVPFGDLPWADQDKPVAVALSAGAKVMRTAATDAAKNTLVSHSVWKIAADGGATLNMQISATGLAALTLQERLNGIPFGMESNAVQKMVRDSGLRGTGTVLYPPVQHQRLAQSAQLQLTLTDFLPDREAGVLNPNPRLSALPIYTGSGNAYFAAMREYAVECTPKTVREEFELQFAPAFKLSHLPKNMALDGADGVHFTADYHRKGNTVRGTRTLVLSQKRNVCAPEDYAKRKPSFDLISRHLRSNVLYQQ